MSMSDIVSALNRTTPTEVALLVFLATFFVIVLRLLLMHRSQIQRAAMMPLDDGPVVTDGKVNSKGASHVKA